MAVAFRVVVKGLTGIKRDLDKDVKQVRAAYRKGLIKACLIVIRQAKKKYLRKSGAQSSKTKLGRVTGNLASTVTHKVSKRGLKALIGWFRHAYAHVVAEPKKGKSKTVIRPRRGKFLFFPLTKSARNVWHLRKGAKSKTEGGKQYIVIGGKQFVVGKDVAFARRVTIHARRPLSRALKDKINDVSEVVLRSIPVLGKKGR